MNKNLSKAMLGNKNSQHESVEKSAVIHVRCTPDQKQQLIVMAKKKEMKVSELVLERLGI